MRLRRWASFQHGVMFVSRRPLQVHVGTSHQEQRVVGYITCTHLHAIEGTVKRPAALAVIPCRCVCVCACVLPWRPPRPGCVAVVESCFLEVVSPPLVRHGRPVLHRPCMCARMHACTVRLCGGGCVCVFACPDNEMNERDQTPAPPPPPTCCCHGDGLKLFKAS